MSPSRNKGAPPGATKPTNADAQASDATGNPSIVSRADAGTSEQQHAANPGARPADYEVGYRRPPRQHQFKTGQSGNPRGRPKGVRSEADILTKLLNKKIPILDHGRTRHISVLEAIYHRIAQNGLKGGDTKSANFLLTRLAAVAQGNSGETPEMNEDDRIVLDTYLAQFMNSQKKGGRK